MEVLFYIGFALFVLFGPWILLWRVNSRRKNDRLEDQLRWADIPGRNHALERGLGELRGTGTAQVGPQSQKQEKATITPAPSLPVQPPVAPLEPITRTEVAAEAWVTRRPAETPRVVSPPVAPRIATPPPSPAARSISQPAPTIATAETGPSRFD